MDAAKVEEGLAIAASGKHAIDPCVSASLEVIGDEEVIQTNSRRWQLKRRQCLRDSTQYSPTPRRQSHQLKMPSRKETKDPAAAWKCRARSSEALIKLRSTSRTTMATKIFEWGAILPGPDQIVDSKLPLALPSEECKDEGVWKAYAKNANEALERANAQTASLKSGLQVQDECGQRRQSRDQKRSDGMLGAICNLWFVIFFCVINMAEANLPHGLTSSLRAPCS